MPTGCVVRLMSGKASSTPLRSIASPMVVPASTCMGCSHSTLSLA
jgi:hypothetical protein